MPESGGSLGRPRPSAEGGAPWYAEGLRFTCAQCGKCCRGPEPGYVWVTPEEIEAIARRLSMTVDAFARLYVRRVGGQYSLVEKANHDCIFWEEGKGCTVYEDRPEQCRTFPFWPEIMASSREWKKYSWCQGKDQGRLYTREEIERLAGGDGATGPQS